ncbi:MAG TPA: hypothetical protein V6C81_16390 [Planktothrix sp.]|jgi:hypothetical protein
MITNNGKSYRQDMLGSSLTWLAVIVFTQAAFGRFTVLCAIGVVLGVGMFIVKAPSSLRPSFWFSGLVTAGAMIAVGYIYGLTTH